MQRSWELMGPGLLFYSNSYCFAGVARTITTTAPPSSEPSTPPFLPKHPPAVPNSLPLHSLPTTSVHQPSSVSSPHPPTPPPHNLQPALSRSLAQQPRASLHLPHQSLGFASSAEHSSTPSPLDHNSGYSATEHRNWTNGISNHRLFRVHSRLLPQNRLIARHTPPTITTNVGHPRSHRCSSARGREPQGPHKDEEGGAGRC